MARTKSSNPDWVVVGGKAGELGHCTRCGEGLSLNLAQRVEVWLAASKEFVKLHRGCKPGQHHEPPATTPQEWLAGRDTGISSKTIYSVMTGVGMGDYYVPCDPDDFGRCYRLLKLFPAWRTRLGEVADRFALWRPMVERWDEMTALYEEELPSDTAPKLYELMKDLRKQGEALERSDDPDCGDAGDSAVDREAGAGR